MLNNIYETVLESNSPVQEQLDAMRQSEYRLSEYSIIKSLLNHTKTSADAGSVTREYNRILSEPKYAPLTNPQVMGKFLSHTAERGNLLELIGTFSNKARYSVNLKLASDLQSYKRESYLKRKGGLSDVFGGNLAEVSKFVGLLADKNTELLKSTPNNKNRKYYRKPVVPGYLADDLHIKKSAVLEALELVSGSNGVVPFVLKDENSNYYVNGKQLFPLREFQHYLLPPELKKIDAPIRPKRREHKIYSNRPKQPG